MARPVKETPILTGKDAKNFVKVMKDNETKRISHEERDRINMALQQFKVITVKI